MVQKIFRYAGFSEESIFGLDPTGLSQLYVDIASGTLDVPSDTEMKVPGGFGRAARRSRPGFYSPAGNIVYAADVNTLAYILKWALGGYKFTAAEERYETEFNLHECYGVDDVLLPSFTAQLGKDVFEHVFMGCVINSLELKVENEYCMATLDVMAKQDKKSTLKEKATITFPVSYPLAFHDASIEIQGSDRSADCKGFTLKITNGASPDLGLGLGSRYTNRIPAGERVVTLDTTVWFEDTDELTRFWGDANGPSINGTTPFFIVLTLDSATYGLITITLPKVIYKDIKQQPSGRNYIQQTATCEAYEEEVEGLDEPTDIYCAIENKIVEITAEES